MRRRFVRPSTRSSPPHGLVDDIIDPGETLRVIIDALEGAETKRQRRAWRKHGVPPV
jgi:acetyl-CoA carboxylase carboxyltransferase component